MDHACTQAFYPGASLLLITLREETRLRAVLPLWEESHRFLGVPISRLRSVTHPDYSCRFDIIHDAGTDQGEISKAIWSSLKAQSGWDEIELSNIPAGGGAEALLSLARHDGLITWQQDLVRSPYIDMTSDSGKGDFTSLVRSANLRRKLRRRWQRLQGLGPVRLFRVESADPEMLARFYALERSGWKGQDGTAIACRPEVRRFYDSVAENATRYGYLFLYFLEVSGKPVAAHFGLTLGGRYFPLKVAYDESFREFSPGHLMLGLVLQDAAQQGVFECDCLGDNEDWKMQWQVEIRPHSVCHIYRNRRLPKLLRFQTRAQHRFRNTAAKFAKKLLSAAGIQSYH